MKRMRHEKVEKKWQKIWEEEGVYEPNLDGAKRPFYNLMMFPYPSAEGLHVGNMYAFTGSDIYGRKKRMEGFQVFQPIGLDGFGIHSENYALKIGKHPREQAKISEANFYKQLRMIGNGFAWREKLETYDPEYYRWTQWILTRLFEAGLMERRKAPVNWCPGCKTVLADEQVLDGHCERCESVVEKKDLEQWFLKITDYAERLLGNLEGLDWSERVKVAQRNWIGRSEGSLLKFQILNSKFHIEVFTTRPDTLFGATYMVLAPEHELVKKLEDRILNLEEVQKYVAETKSKTEEERLADGQEKTGVELKGIQAIHPAHGEEISVWVADYVLGGYGTGAIMAVPAHDARDYAFAKKYGLLIKIVVCPNYPEKTCPVLEEVYEGDGYLVDSGKFDGMDSEVAKWEITKFVKGERKTQYRLRDWLISRQRYWGPPIPLIFCDSCKKLVESSKSQTLNSKGELLNPGWFAVPEEELPVRLPDIQDVRPEGESRGPLAKVEEFWKTICPKCGGEARRETDVSDTFLDSAWYYIAYCVRENSKFQISNSRRIKKWLPVDMYIGGAEHSVLHLLYSRFLAMALKDLKLVDFEEPFTRFRAHGLLIKEGAKMSKSKGNVINPDEYIEKFGADVLRTYLMFLAPFEQGGDFRDEAVMGTVRFLERIWKFFDCSEIMNYSNLRKDGFVDSDAFVDLDRLLHKTIKKVTEDIEGLKYNTAISQLMIFLNFVEKNQNKELRIKNYGEAFLKLLAPFAPHMTEEIWRGVLKRESSIHLEKWPEHDSNLIEEETFQLVVQVNGKTRATFEAEKGITQARAEELAREAVSKYMERGGVKKVVFVQDRLINFVM